MGNKLIGLMVVFLFGALFVPVVSAEQVISNTTVTISANNDTVHLASQFGGQDFSLADLANNSQAYNFQFVADLLCSQDVVNQNLQNYTATVASACAINIQRLKDCDGIYTTNTELSFENLALKANQSACDTLTTSYNSLLGTSNAQQATITAEADYNDVKNQRWEYGVIGLLLGLGGMWYYYNHGKQSRSSSKQPSALGGYNQGDNVGSYPTDMDKDPRLNKPELGKDQKP